MEFESEQTRASAIRFLLLASGLALYVALTLWLLAQGHMRTTLADLAPLVGIWVFGVAALTVWRHLNVTDQLEVTGDVLILSRATWANLGVVIMAALVWDATRWVLLIAPVFGVLYAALYLRRDQILLIAVGTWCAYFLCDVALTVFGGGAREFEWITLLAFGAMLVAGVLLGGEVIRARDVLAARNAGLRSALERLQELASKDELTQVHNRRFIMDVLKRQKALADRGQGTFSVCYCDLDHFKLINDRYGHAAGDAMLKEFANVAFAVVRNVDYVARYGGEEFLLVLVDADEAESRRVAQRLADRTRQIWLPGTPTDQVMTVSVGITRYRRGERVDDLLRRADRALYTAKAGGRDRVVVHGESLDPPPQPSPSGTNGNVHTSQ